MNITTVGSTCQNVFSRHGEGGHGKVIIGGLSDQKLKIPAARHRRTTWTGVAWARSLTNGFSRLRSGKGL